MPKKIEKPEPFGRGYLEDEDFNKLRKVKPEQLDKCHYKMIPSTQGPSTISNNNFQSSGTLPTNTNNTDGALEVLFNGVKSLDANRYATKKTIAQGMLDIALLTANASQLKYILQVGKQHEFYTLMLTLICLSIGLQLLQGIIFIFLGSSLNINKQGDQKKANLWNNIALALMILTVAINVVMSVFELHEQK